MQEQKKGEAEFPSAAQTRRGRSVGRALGKGGGSSRKGRAHFREVLAMEGGLLMNLHTCPQEQGSWANPLKCWSYLAQILQ